MFYMADLVLKARRLEALCARGEVTVGCKEEQTLVLVSVEDQFGATRKERETQRMQEVLVSSAENLCSVPSYTR